MHTTYIQIHCSMLMRSCLMPNATHRHTDIFHAQMNAFIRGYYCRSKWVFNIFLFLFCMLCAFVCCLNFRSIVLAKVSLCNVRNVCTVSNAHTNTQHIYERTYNRVWCAYRMHTSTQVRQTTKCYVYNCNYFRS